MKPYLLLPAVLLPFSSSLAGTLHVNASATGADDGSSWVDAFPTLQDALAIASPGDAIWVAAGTYYPDEGAFQLNNSRASSFELLAGVAIYGGFAGTEVLLDERDPAANPTILSGDLTGNDGPNFTNNSDNAYHVVFAGGGLSTTSVLDGFTVTAGNANGSGTNANGGGIVIGGGSPALVNCLIEANSADDDGGGLYMVTSAAQITRCRFEANQALVGGAIFLANTTATLDGCLIRGNEAEDGGGLLHTSDSSTLVNCVVQGNCASSQGAGIFLSNSPISVTNCSLQGNKAALNGGGIFVANSSPAFANTVIWNNSANGSVAGASASIFVNTGTPTYAYCLIEGLNPGGTNFNGTNALNDPLFLDPVNPATAPVVGGDLHVDRFSPVINSGNSALNSTLVDAENLPRKVSAIDLGAYERQTRHFVNASATGNANGYTWQHAFTTLQDALATAVSGDEIWVAAGTYHPDEGGSAVDNDRTSTFTLIEGVSLYGGFSGTETSLAQSDPVANPTILSGDLLGNDGADFANNDENAYTVVTSSELYNATTFDGFIITAGNANGGFAPYNRGGGIAADNSNFFTISNCRIEGNFGIDGGGMYSVNAAPNFKILRCNFSGNEAWTNGGALYNTNSYPLIENCYFEGNHAGTLGGAIYHFGINSSAKVQQCVFRANTATNGGAVANNAALPSYVNCSFGYNSANNGGAMLTTHAAAAPTMTNCVLWGNLANGSSASPTSSVWTSSGTVTYSHCLVQGLNLAGNNLDGTDPANDPLFVSSSNLRLQSGSPANGVGLDSANLLATDLDGNPRIVPKAIDLGAYESPYLGGFTIDNVRVRLGYGSQQFIATWVADPINEGFDVSIELIDTTPGLNFTDGPRLVLTDSLSFVEDSGIAGVATLRVTITDPGGTYTPVSLDRTIRFSPFYVRAGATGLGDGFSWEDAIPNLQTAISLSSGVERGEIWVAAGTYWPDIGGGNQANDRDASFLLRNYLSILGGFDGTETLASQRDPATNLTILSGDLNEDDVGFSNNGENSYSVVSGYGGKLSPSAVLDGFTIRGGNRSGGSGGGIICDNDSPTIRNCHITRNSANQGGGAAFADGSPRIEGCRFSDNQATSSGGGAVVFQSCSAIVTDSLFDFNYAFNSDGGAIRCYISLIKVSNCTFQRNEAQHGGAIHNSFSYTLPELDGPHYTNCIFRGNRAGGNGGAIYNDGSATRHYNCVFQGNYAGFYGGAIMNEGIPTTTVNCSIQGNRSNSNPGGGIYNLDCNPVIANTIVWNNRYTTISNSGLSSVYNVNSTPVYSHSLIHNINLTGTGTGNLNGTNAANNPLFVTEVDPVAAPSTAGDLHLPKLTPVRDIGLYSANPIATDLDGNARVQWGAIDLGAYEQGQSLLFADFHPGLLKGNDDNGNGLSNFEDYAFGLNPLAPGAPGDLVSLDGNLLTLRHRSNADIAVEYQMSGNLSQWDTMVEGEDYSIISTTRTQVTLELIAGPGEVPRQFFREELQETTP